MASDSAIEWTDATWNPVTGCTKVSPGCKFCYAERLTERFGRGKFTDVTLHPDRLELPLHWRTPRMIFVNSMSDLFHERVPLQYVDQVFEIMTRATHHVFQVLTKRPERLVAWHRIRRERRVRVESRSAARGGRTSPVHQRGTAARTTVVTRPVRGVVGHRRG